MQGQHSTVLRFCANLATSSTRFADKQELTSKCLCIVRLNSCLKTATYRPTLEDLDKLARSHNRILSPARLPIPPLSRRFVPTGYVIAPHGQTPLASIWGQSPGQYSPSPATCIERDSSNWFGDWAGVCQVHRIASLALVPTWFLPPDNLASNCEYRRTGGRNQNDQKNHLLYCGSVF